MNEGIMAQLKGQIFKQLPNESDWQLFWEKQKGDSVKYEFVLTEGHQKSCTFMLIKEFAL